MNVLVTGGTGFVGPAVVRALAAAGHDVRVLERTAGAGGDLPAEGVVGDVTEPETLAAAVEGQDVVVHLVAIIHGSREDFRRIMADGTRNLLAAAKAAGVKRFVHMSALGVSEETRKLTPYYEAKWDMEQDVRASGIDHVIFRPSFVLGRDGGVLPMWARIARLAPVTPVVGSGERRFQPIWIDDVGAYFASAVDHPAAGGRTFEIGGPDVVSWNEFWKALKRALGVSRPAIHVPVAMMKMQAAVMELLPNPMVTRDQLKMLEAGDNVVEGSEAVETFAIPLKPLDEQLRLGTAKA